MKISVRSVLSAVRDGVRTQLWPIPTLGILVALILGVAVPLLDAAVDDSLPSWLNNVVFNGDAGAARTVLSAVSSSLITVTSLTFSLTVVTLQLASSQFSPRLLRTFTQDVFVQVTLAVFLMTFVFALTVLRSVRSTAETGSAAFVPRLAVTATFVLALASVVALVLFLAHLTRQIRVETMLLRVGIEARSTMDDNLLRRDDEGAGRQAPATPADAQVVWAQSSGFLAGLRQDYLVELASDAGAVLRVDRHPGSFVAEGTPLARVWTHDNRPLDHQTLDRLRDRVADAIRLGPERTAGQDVGFGLRQLTDIANKALSPGINDPTTAIHALGRTGVVLGQLARFDLGPLVLDGADGRVAVVLDRPGFPHFLQLGVSQPRSYGESDPQVLAALYGVLEDVAWHVDPEQHQPVLNQLRRLDETVAEQDFDSEETEHLADLSDEVRRVLSTGAEGTKRPADR